MLSSSIRTNKVAEALCVKFRYKDKQGHRGDVKFKCKDKQGRRGADESDFQYKDKLGH